MGIGLYIHIPFCKKKCNYCDFVSLGIGEGAPIVERVAERLVCDVSRETEVCNSISSVFIGGGTPSVVPVGVMEPLLAVIRERIEDDAEWTIECTPGTVDA